MDESRRAFAVCIGEVHNLYLNHEPPVIGATYLKPTPEYEFGVQFLVSTEEDLARGQDQDLLSRLKHSMEEAMQGHNLPCGGSTLDVGLSSLEAEGIKR